MEVLHKHRCDGCGTVWAHSHKARNRHEYHTCPQCGKEEWRPYDGEDEASVVQAVEPKRRK